MFPFLSLQWELRGLRRPLNVGAQGYPEGAPPSSALQEVVTHGSA